MPNDTSGQTSVNDNINNPTDTRVLVVGGGFAGMGSAIVLKRLGYHVELIDLDPEWRVYGAGITITGPTLRAYKHLGMVDDIAQQGAISNGAKIFTYKGDFLHALDEPPIEKGLPATGGIMRPKLHTMMSNQVRALGIPVELGITIDAISQYDNKVEVTFSNGNKGTYDLLLGSDGVNSKVRKLVFPEAEEPKPTGQGCWRISMNLPPTVKQVEFYLGHQYPAGITPCGPDQMYMWMLTPDDGSLWVDEENGHAMLREKLQDFGGTVGWIRDNMTADHWVNYRPLAAIIQPKSAWVKGRVLLIGDSAHATTPHLASGAGMAVEGAVVLGQELEKEGRSLDNALAAYVERRFDRCQDVVTTSIGIGQKQLDGCTPEDVGSAISAANHRLARPF